MSLSNNPAREKGHSEREQKLTWLEAVFYPLIKANFAFSVMLNQWRQDRFSSLASRLTSWQTFFLTGGLSLWLIPPVKTWNDIYWASGTLLFLFFCSLFGMHKWVLFVIYKSKAGSKVTKSRNQKKLQYISLLITILLFSFFCLTIILKAYWYHTRFFWWNH